MQTRFKYPRTPHLPWSPGGSSDDAYLADVRQFEGREVVVTEKMDGENTSLYADGMHARSIDSRHHPSRDWVKALLATLAHDIPEGWRLCGENLYARHSVGYGALESYFYLFSIWDAENRSLDWDRTVEWAGLLGLATVPVLYRGPWDEDQIRSLDIDIEHQEGYVVRTVDGFDHAGFADHLAKWVRKGHVQTDQHWMFSEIVPNGLRGREESHGE